MDNYVLELGNGMMITVCPRGGMVHGWVNADSGQRMLYPFFIREEDGKERGGSPVPFPAFGSPVPVYAGENQHGWLRDTQMAMTMGQFCVEAMTSRRIGGLFADRVTVHMIHSLAQRSLISILRFLISEEFARKSEKPIFRPAFHDYFPNDGKTEVIINGKKYTEFTDDARCIPLNGQSNIIVDTGEVKMRMNLIGFDPNIACIYLWSDAPDEYFCVEPVYCSREVFLEGKHLIALAGEIVEVGRMLEILD